MRSLGNVDVFTAGAVGSPGHRAFYLQVGGDDTMLWFLIEKQQVAALAERTHDVLQAFDEPPDQLERQELDPPGEVAFRVGEIAMGILDDRAVVVLHPTDENLEPVEFSVGLDRLAVMATQAFEVVAAGRPLCPRCSLPRDPEGHACPASNGDLRHHRP